jgi:EVE domain
MKNWIAIASADHVARGREGGFMQVCHGKQAPLKRIHPGDRVVYYSPTQTMGGNDRLQAFTALGHAKDHAPYLFDMGGGFCPFRRDVTWFETGITPIRPLLGQLDFTRGKSNWGYAFRFGILEISDHDGDLIAQAMGAPPHDPDQGQPLLL